MSIVRKKRIFYTARYTYSLDPSPGMCARPTRFWERKMKKQWMLAPLVAAGVLGSWILLHGNSSQAQSAPGGPPPEVTVAQALTREVSDSAAVSGGAVLSNGEIALIVDCDALTARGNPADARPDAAAADGRAPVPALPA